MVQIIGLLFLKGTMNRTEIYLLNHLIKKKLKHFIYLNKKSSGPSYPK